MGRRKIAIKYQNVQEFVWSKDPETYNFVEDTQDQMTAEADKVYHKMSEYDKYFAYRAVYHYNKVHNTYLISDSAICNVLKFVERAKAMKMLDPDNHSQLLQQIYRQLWPSLAEKPYMTEEDRIASDTMTSAQTTVNSLLKKLLDVYAVQKMEEIYKNGRGFASTNCSIVLAANNKETGFYNELDDNFPALKNFLALYHTLGNYCPVPVGFNAARSNGGRHDYWDLSLRKIYDWYMFSEAEYFRRDDLIQRELLHGKGCYLNCKKWLEDFGIGEDGWHNFVTTYFFEDYVDDKGEPKMFWEGHSWEKCQLPEEWKLPQDKAIINSALAEINERIVKRAKRMTQAFVSV